ncbi:hypothetical protein F4604DRAFT_1916312 [Suillus subluteus]|nr:hypothetical protein F4604DRAFT_1916312 [Suillus subluteus]
MPFQPANDFQIHTHGDYPSTSSSHQGLYMDSPPHTFPDGHNMVVVHYTGPIYNSMALHIMHDPQSSLDASNSNSMASSSSHNFNLQPPMSNDPQPPSDPMPEVTKKLGQGIQPSNHKTKRPQTKFVSSKYTPQESPLVIIQAPSSSPLVFISLEFI